MTRNSTSAKASNRGEAKLPNLTIGLFGRKGTACAAPTMPQEDGRLLAEISA